MSIFNHKDLEQVWRYLMLFFCVVMYFLWLPHDKLASISLALLVLFSIAYIVFFRKDLIANKVVFLSLITVIYLYLSTFFRVEIMGNEAVRFKDTEKLASFFVFVFVGFSMGYTKNAERLIIFSLLTGCLMYLLINFNLADWQAMLAGKRADFGIRNAQHSGSIFLLLSLVALFLTELKQKLIVCIIFGFFLILMLAGQVRAILLGLAIAGVFYLAMAFLSKKLKPALYLLLFSSIFIAFLFSFQKENIENRMSSESKDLQGMMLYLEDGKIIPTSTAVRVASWDMGIEWFLQKPLLGHGAGQLKVLIKNSEEWQRSFGGRYGHLHNSYLEILVAYGLVGFLLFSGVALILVYAFICKLKLEVISLVSNKKFIFFLFFLTTWGVANFFESYMFYPSGIYINSFFFGYLFYIAYLKKIKEPV